MNNDRPNPYLIWEYREDRLDFGYWVRAPKKGYSIVSLDVRGLYRLHMSRKAHEWCEEDLTRMVYHKCRREARYLDEVLDIKMIFLHPKGWRACIAAHLWFMRRSIRNG